MNQNLVNIVTENTGSTTLSTYVSITPKFNIGIVVMYNITYNAITLKSLNLSDCCETIPEVIGV